MNILLLGKNGQLGWELHRSLQPLGKVYALDFPELDMADGDNIRQVVANYDVDVIINATAYTDVDRAESEPELAQAINADGPEILAQENLKLNTLLIHFSTDYVFDGEKGSPYVETDTPNPLNAYGLSKLNGEQAIQAAGGNYLILRTSWLYSLRRGGFVNKVLEWARQNEELRIVDDQVANPTWARMLAEITAQILARGCNYFSDCTGLYHLAGAGYASRFEWARLILALDPGKGDYRVRAIQPAKTSDFPTPAQRPLFSALDCQKFFSTFGLCLPPWQQVFTLAVDANQE